jgi:hypothetical protein
MEIIAEKEGFKVMLQQDEFPESPREWDNLGTMLWWHRRYNSPDENEFKTSLDFKEFWDETGGVRFPVFLLDHSGLWCSIHSFNDPWDSGQIGWIYVTKEKIIAEYGEYSDETIEKAKDCLKGEVETYNQYLTGEVYGYIVTDENDTHMDSCFGHFGYDFAVEAAKEALDSWIKYSKKENTLINRSLAL